MPPLRPNTPEQVAQRLTELARFHAQRRNSAVLQPGGRWNVLSPIWKAATCSTSLQEDVWQRFLDLPRGRAASIRFHDRKWMSDTPSRLDTLADRLPQTVLHGDTHLGNLYVEADGTPGCFDSVPHRWMPFCEIAYHIGAALDQPDRREHERALVAEYLRELQARSISPPRMEDATEYCAALLAFGFCIFMVNEATCQPEAINTALPRGSAQLRSITTQSAR
jgi:Ser/Thr protein kinase RdoA (MazF antagonist)